MSDDVLEDEAGPLGVDVEWCAQPVARGCATGGPGSAWWVVALLAWRRRRC